MNAMTTLTTQTIVPGEWQDEVASRVERIARALAKTEADCLLIADNVNIFYTTARVVAGFVLIHRDGRVWRFVRRPVGLTGENVHYVHKPELIAQCVDFTPRCLALLGDRLTHAEWQRLSCVFGDGVEVIDASRLMSGVRAVKSEREVELLKQDAAMHIRSYAAVPSLYRPGMTDVELQIELERELRRNGCLGLFRIHGASMELFMASVLTGDNADAASPYDFAMGGAGSHLSLPVGANGTVITPGSTVMVDACGNFNGYMTDMTRCYYLAPLSEEAVKAHRVSIDIHRRLAVKGRPGVQAAALYNEALAMATEAGLAACFMGHRQQAGFVGHGVGIEVNEAPVLAPRSRDVLEEGHVIALEPKFVVPGVGAVGVENTYVVRATGLENLTPAPEQLLPLNA